MSGKTKIEWATKVWNPTVGCTPVTEGCAHCYAKRMYDRFYQNRSFSQVQLHPERREDPLRWRTPQRVFVDSMSDLFHDEVPWNYIDDVMDVIAKCPQHIFLVLTKRAKRMQAYFAIVQELLRISDPLQNLWLGVSVSSNDDLWMIDELLHTPAAVRFVSVEPMLGPVDLRGSLAPSKGVWPDAPTRILDWVICGGETGPGARYLQPLWVADLRDQCVEANVPFFFKQWGDLGGPFWKMNRELRKQNKRILDGRTWDQFPEVK